jgi:hypothetical protein
LVRGTMGEHTDMSHIHLVGGEKGGVGKSTVARLLAQAFIDREQAFVALDGDRSHGDLLRFYADYTVPLNLDENASADAILLSAIETDQAVLVDLPAQSAHALQNWIQESGVLDLAKELDIPLTYWHVTDGSRNSVELLQRAIDDFSDSDAVAFVIVRNAGRGGNFEAFGQSTAKARAEATGARTIDLARLDDKVMSNIDWQNLSFWAAAHRDQGECLSLLDRQRVRSWYARWQEQLGGLLGSVPQEVPKADETSEVIQFHSGS